MLGDQRELINYEAVRIKNCVCVCLYSGMRIDYTFLRRIILAPVGLYVSTVFFHITSYNYNNKLQLGCHPVAVVILHVYKI